MKPVRIALHNFARYVATDFCPNGGRLLIVTGDSGAGKSSLVSDSLRYALFGAARLRAPHLLRRGASDMSVSIELEHAGHTYRIVRGYSSKAGGKSFAEFHVRDTGPDDTVGWIPLTGDTIADTDARIAEVLRLDAATFVTSSLLVQGAIGAFADAKATERKRVFAAALGIEHPWTEAEAFARERVRASTVEADAGRLHVATLTDQLAERPALAEAEAEARSRGEHIVIEAGMVEVELDEHRRALVELAARLADAARAEADVATASAAIDAETERWKAAGRRRGAAIDADRAADVTLAHAPRIAEAQRRLPELRAELAAAEAAQAAWTEANDAWLAARDAARDAELDHERARRDVEAAHATAADRVAQLQSQVDALAPVTCPSCGTEFAADPAGLQDRLGSALQAVEAAPRTLAEPRSLRVLREAADSARAAVGEQPDLALAGRLRDELLSTELLAQQTDALEAARASRSAAIDARIVAEADMAAAEAAGTAARRALDAARERLAGLGPLRAERDGHDAEIERLTQQQRTLADEAQLAEGRRAAAAARLAQLDAAESERDETQARLAHLGVEVGRLERLVTAFSPKGIPARIIDSAIPELVADANSLLMQLLPGWSVDIRTQRAKRSGDGLVEALDIIVRDEESGEGPIEGLSGGERTSLSLALAVAISRVAARRSGAAVRSLVIDEPDGLSPALRRALGQALKVLAHSGELERITVITHTPDLVDFGDEVYHVTRDSAGSHVELVS